MGTQIFQSNTVDNILKYGKIKYSLLLKKLKSQFHDLTESEGQRIPNN